MLTSQHLRISNLLHTMAKYSQQPLLESSASRDPAELMRQWINDARLKEIPLPLVGTLSTVNLPSARVSARLVNLKDYTEDGTFLFSTDWVSSRKSEDIRSNPQVALTFYHQVLDRSIRVEGKAHPLPSADAEKYWQSQPRSFQTRYSASDQSTKVQCREVIERKIVEQENVPGIPNMPKKFSRVEVVPTFYEFWQGREDGIADRLTYEKTVHGWNRRRLEP